jgi:hypothetical protein
LTASDADIIETARRRANNMAMILSAKEDWALANITIRIGKPAIQEPKGDTLEARKMHLLHALVASATAKSACKGN